MIAILSCKLPIAQVLSFPIKLKNLKPRLSLSYANLSRKESNEESLTNWGLMHWPKILSLVISNRTYLINYLKRRRKLNSGLGEGM